MILDIQCNYLKRIFQEIGSLYINEEETIKNKLFKMYISGEIDKINQHLARVQTIKRFTLLPHPFSLENGELTPTMKIKRRKIKQKNKSNPY